MKMRCWYISIALFIICHNSIFAQNNTDSVIVLPIKMVVPANAILKGTIKSGNNSTETHCDYERVIADAKITANRMGGNIVKITQLIPPVFISKCYKIKADIYYADKIPDSLFKKVSTVNIQSQTRDHATLYIYRLPDTIMLASSYDIHLNDDSVICTVKSKSRDSINIYKEGAQILWAKTEERAALKMDVKFGEKYYIRCGLKGGQFRKIPVIELMDKETGAIEYQKIKKKKKRPGNKIPAGNALTMKSSH